jgi:TniQ protein
LSGRHPERLWTIRPRPQDDEILSSWIVRIAGSYGVGPLTFFSEKLPEFNVVGRDLDRVADYRMVVALSEKTGVAFERLREAQLCVDEGYIFPAIRTFGTTQWVIPLGRTGTAKDTASNGLPYCPHCLREDRVPYFRRAWRYAFVPACARHSLLMPHTCPNCTREVNYYIRGMAKQLSLGEDALLTCSHCGSDLREHRGEQVDASLVASAIQHQQFLLQGIQEGRLEVPSYGPVFSVQFMRVLRGIMGILVSETVPSVIVLRIAKAAGVDPKRSTYIVRGHARTRIEHRDGVERAELLCIACWLMEEWPDRFANFCAQTRLDRTLVTPFMTYGRVLGFTEN